MQVCACEFEFSFGSVLGHLILLLDSQCEIASEYLVVSLKIVSRSTEVSWTFVCSWIVVFFPKLVRSVLETDSISNRRSLVVRL